MNNIMKKVFYKITILIMMIVLGLGTTNVSSLYDVKADGFDGDIMDNPFADLFVDDEPGDAVIDNKVQMPSVKVTKTRLKKLLKTSIKSATRKNKKSRKAKVILKKITKVKRARYQIKYAQNKKFKKAKVKSFKNNRVTLKKLKRKGRYYIKARAYVKGSNGKKVYGKWTKRKVIK